jgi:shikimate dehydrogenase
VGDTIDPRAFEVVINATSASLDHQALNLPESLLAAKPFCYDLAYHLDKPTVFVAWAKAHGCDAVDGLGMLVEQAAEAFSLWHAQVPETMQVLALLRKKSFDGL